MAFRAAAIFGLPHDDHSQFIMGANASTAAAPAIPLSESRVDGSSWPDRLLTVGQFCFIGGFGAILNALPLLLTLCTRLRRHEVNIMIMNLASADFLLCVSFLFGQTFYILWHEKLPSAGCHFLSFFHFTMAFASFIFPPVLAINRYISLYHNPIYRRIYTKSKVFKMMAACWSFCSVVPFVFMMAGKTGYDSDNHHCCMVLHGDVLWTVAYWIVIIAPLVVFCDGTMIYCNYKIYKKLNEHASQQDLDKNIIRKHKEILYFLLADMAFPIMFHSMYHIFKFVLVNRKSEFLKRFFMSLYLLNSVLRGIVTLIMLRPYRSAFQHMVCRVRRTKGGVISLAQSQDESNSLRYRSTTLMAYTKADSVSNNGGGVQTALLTTVKSPRIDEDQDSSEIEL